MRNHIILEGAWGLGKTPVAKCFSTMHGYKFIQEPSHLTEARAGTEFDLQDWYRRAHIEREAFLFEHAPCVLERSILSVYAFEYARDGILPATEDVARFSRLLEETKTIVVVLSSGFPANQAARRAVSPIESVERVRSDVAAMKRYFDFYEHVLPWQTGIVPLILAPINVSAGRDAQTIAGEIRAAIGAQRMAQVNVICLDVSAPPDDPRILLMRRCASRGGFWQAITGGIHPGEPLPTAALREVEEETGLRLSQAQLEATQFSHAFTGNDGYQLIEYVVVAGIKKTDAVQRSKEHDEVRWVSVADAKALMVYESNRTALDYALNAVKKTRSGEPGESMER